MGEESDCPDEMARESHELDTGGPAVNMEELLRMLEAAVEKEKTCEGLGANSDNMLHLKNGETTCSSSAGTPNSMYSACSASGSTFSRGSYVKEKSVNCVETSQEGLPCPDEEAQEAGCVEGHGATEVRIRTNLEAASWEERMEATLDTVGESQQHLVSEDFVSESGTRRGEDHNDADTSVSIPENFPENFQSLKIEMVELDANYLSNQSSGESCASEGQGVLDDDMHRSISLNASVDVVAVAGKRRDSPLGGTMGSNAATSSLTETGEAFIRCVSKNSLDPLESIVEGDASSNLSGHDGTIRQLKTTEKSVLVCGTEGFSTDIRQADVPATAVETSVERVEGVVSALSNTYKEGANHARTSQLEAIHTLDCETPRSSYLTGDKVGGHLTDANIDACGNSASLRGNNLSYLSTIRERYELLERDNPFIKICGPELVSEDYKVSTYKTAQSSREPSANCLKDGDVLKVKDKFRSKENTRDGPAVIRYLQKVNTRTATAEVLIDSEDLVDQLVTSGHETGPQQFKSTPKVLCALEGMLAEASDHGSLERPIKAHEYFKQYGWDEAKLRNCSDVIHERKQFHCLMKPELELSNGKKSSMNIDELTQGADQPAVGSKLPFEYHMGVHRYGLENVGSGTVEERTAALDCRTTAAIDYAQLCGGDSQLGEHPYTDEQKLAHPDDVVEHAVGFSFSCCTPSKSGRRLGSESSPCCNGRTLVRDSSQSLHTSNENDSIFSNSTFLEMEKAASSCAPRISSKQTSDWDNVDSRRSSDSSNESSTPSESIFDRLLRYGGSCTPVSRGLIGTSVLPKLAEDDTKKSNSGSSAPAHLGGCNDREKVTVVVRMRPFAEHEKMCPLKQILCLPEDKVIVKENNVDLLKQSCPRSKEFRDAGFSEYKVDNVVDDSYLQKHRWDKKAESQRRMYELVGLPCLECALEGYNTTIMAYGQTGSGKTFTMMGDDTDEGRGIMPRLAEMLMNQINTELRNDLIVQVSYLEIYQERIRDLLVQSKVEAPTAKAEWQGSVDSGASRCGSVMSERRCSESLGDSVYEESMDGDTASYLSFGTCLSSKGAPSVCFDSPSTKKESLKVREHPLLGPYVEGLLWKDVCTWDDMEQVLLEGATRRTLGTSPSNRFSNRGHTMFTIRLFKERGRRSSDMRVINLVDLAGTEKPNLAKRVSPERLDESRYINRSIAHLNDVILNLSRNSKFVSYRNSCLTKLLRNSLGGNYKTFFVAHLSPSEQDFQESVNTLRYAAKASHIQSTLLARAEKKKRFIVNTKKEVEVLHDLVQNLARKEEEERREQEVKNQGSCFPVLSSFKVPRIAIPENSAWSGSDLGP